MCLKKIHLKLVRLIINNKIKVDKFNEVYLKVYLYSKFFIVTP